MAKTKTEETALVNATGTGDVPAVLDFSQDAGAGMETLTVQDYAIPFLTVLQMNSPQCNPAHAGYIQGVRPGMLCNTATGEAYEHLFIIPCAFAHRIVEWRPDRKGFVKAHERGAEPTDTHKGDTRKDEHKTFRANGNTLDETNYHYVLAFAHEGDIPFQAILSFKSTQLKKSRKWNSLMQGLKLMGTKGAYTPASYASVYKLGSTSESNDLGTFFGFKVERVDYIKDPAIYNAAKEFAANALGAKVNYETEGATTTEATAATADGVL